MEEEITKEITMELSGKHFESDKHTARVIERGKVLVEIIICKDGLIITQEKKTFIKFKI